MRILLNDNTVYNMEEIPNEVEDIRYGVLDFTDKQNPDYFFIPLVFLEVISIQAVVLRIGEHTFKMPMDWHIIVCNDVGDTEVLPLTQISDKGFSAFTLNPITSYMPEFHEVDIMSIYNEVRWHIPKLQQGHLLAVPITDDENPQCAFFVKEANKVPEILDMSTLF